MNLLVKRFFIFVALLMIFSLRSYALGIDSTGPDNWNLTNFSAFTDFSAISSTDAKHGNFSMECWGIGSHGGFVEIEKNLGYTITRPSEEFSMFDKLILLTPNNTAVFLRVHLYARKDENSWEFVGSFSKARNQMGDPWMVFPNTFFVGQNFISQYNKLKIKFIIEYPPNNQTVEFRIRLDYLHHSTNAGLTYLSMIDDFGDLTGIQNQTETAEKFQLNQNYPNPFNPMTNIKFSIPNQEFVNLIVYDISGREIEVLVNERLNKGSYKVDWNASSLSSGTYFYRITAGSFTDTKKMTLIK